VASTVVVVPELDRCCQLLTLSWLNPPCPLKAAIGYGKRTLGDPRQSVARRGHAKAAAASAFARRSERDMLNLSLSGHDPSLP
jgi:hypothetical protein